MGHAVSDYTLGPWVRCEGFDALPESAPLMFDASTDEIRIRIVRPIQLVSMATRWTRRKAVRERKRRNAWRRWRKCQKRAELAWLRAGAVAYRYHSQPPKAPAQPVYRNG